MVDVLDQEIMAWSKMRGWHGKPARARSKLGSKIFDCRDAADADALHYCVIARIARPGANTITILMRQRF